MRTVFATGASFYQHPLGLTGLLVEEHPADLADPVALGIDRGAVDVVRRVLRGSHGCLPCAGAGRAAARHAWQLPDRPGYPATTATNNAKVQGTRREGGYARGGAVQDRG